MAAKTTARQSMHRRCKPLSRKRQSPAACGLARIRYAASMAAKNPIVIAHHIMWTLYGWWLPNDPRGSTSRTIRSDLITDLGDLHFGRKQLQPASRTIREFYEQAAGVLKHPLLSFSPGEFASVGEAIGQVITDCRYTCYACAVMPDHVHLVIRKHKDLAEAMIEKIQSLSRKRLVAEGIRDVEHPTWTRGGWKVFLDHPDEIWRSIRYVEQNPTKMRLLPQHWPFVASYDNWPLHVGHSPNSPYAKALWAAGRYPR
jgi:REP element-mobilizing transposase RayT